VRRVHGLADLLRQRYYAYGVRIPRWLFVRLYGEPRIRLPKGSP
jgi:hypothetical protein